MTTNGQESLSAAFILHTRKYRDTSLIADLLTETEGRLSVVIRGARGKRSRYPGSLQPFVPLLVSWYGRGELKTARSIDFPGRASRLNGEALLTGMYVNELLYRLLGKFDPVPAIFSAYGELLAVLEGSVAPHAALRRFEMVVLAELGYGISLDVEAGSGEAVQDDRLYRYVPEEGLIPLPAEVYDGHDRPPPGTFSGRDLLAVARGQLEDPVVERTAWQITRSSLNVLLGDRPLKSREILLKQRELP
ncbi:MAG: DNA repair protein RecO [Pseudomonadales bacterium]|nr:DNA repair protein RecO [Pseudomonadales bacterium]